LADVDEFTDSPAAGVEGVALLAAYGLTVPMLLSS
jgi:hypothetical protein